jgi:hypothetical protein
LLLLKRCGLAFDADLHAVVTGSTRDAGVHCHDVKFMVVTPALNSALKMCAESRVLSNAIRSATSLPSYPTVYTVKGSAFLRGEVRALRGLLGITLLPGRLLELVTDSLAREAVTARDKFFAVADLWFIACPAYLAGTLAQSGSSARHRRPVDPCHDRPAPLARGQGLQTGRWPKA